MKRLIFILCFLPLLIFGQVNVDISNGRTRAFDGNIEVGDSAMFDNGSYIFDDATDLYVIPPAAGKGYIMGHIIAGNTTLYPCVYSDSEGGSGQAVFRMRTASNYGFGGSYLEPEIVVAGVPVLTAPTDGSGIVIDGELTTDNSFAEMYNPATVISTATTGKYYALLGWTAGLTNAATADVVDSMMIIDQAGTYRGTFSFSFTHSNVTVINHICGFVRDGAGAWVEYSNAETERKIGTGGDVGSVSATWLMQLSAGDTLGIRMRSDKTGNFTVNHGNFNVTRIK